MKYLAHFLFCSSGNFYMPSISAVRADVWQSMRSGLTAQAVARSGFRDFWYAKKHEKFSNKGLWSDCMHILTTGLCREMQG